MGKLYRVIYDAASNYEARVSTVLKNKLWSWNPIRSDHLGSIQRKLHHLVVLKEDDRALWANSNKFDFAGK